MSAYLRYYDDRYGDLYEIYVSDVTGEFEGASRSVEAIGRDPIYYDHLGEIPVAHRGEIENLVEAYQKTHQLDGYDSAT